MLTCFKPLDIEQKDKLKFEIFRIDLVVYITNILIIVFDLVRH